MITCYKCMPLERPQVIVVEKLLGGELCETCGNAKVNIVERMDWEPTEKQLKEYEEKMIAEREGEVMEVMTQSPETFTKGQEEGIGTITPDSVMEVKPPAEPVVNFEELHGMNSVELMTLALKVGVPVKEGEEKEAVIQRIKDKMMEPA